MFRIKKFTGRVYSRNSGFSMIAARAGRRRGKRERERERERESEGSSI
jgi:hypothetical protein